MPTTGAPRLLEKFVALDGSLTYTFPTYFIEQQTSQGIYTPSSVAIGANYPYDLLGTKDGPLNEAVEAIAFDIMKPVGGTDIDAELDNMRSYCKRIGLGKLYIADAAAAERWSYARLSAMPSISWRTGDGFFQQHASLQFKRRSNWFDVAQSTPNSGAVVATPTTFTINNPGNARVYAVAIKLHANTAPGFNNPVIQNLSNGYSWSSTRTSTSIGDELIVDAGLNTVAFNGIDDYTRFTRGSTQVAYFALEPGNNSIQYSGGAAPNVTITFTFYGAYH